MSGVYVIFTLNSEEYCIDILNAKEIMRVKGIVINKIPKMPKFIEGIINLRGDVIPIMNLKTRFSVNDRKPGKRIIIIENQKLILGFLVDSIVEVIEISEEKVIAPPEDVTTRCEYVDSIVCMENRMIFILNINKVLDLERSEDKWSNLI